MFRRQTTFAIVLLVTLSGVTCGAQSKEDEKASSAKAAAEPVVPEQGGRKRLWPRRVLAKPERLQEQSILKPQEVQVEEADVTPKASDLAEPRQTLIIRLENIPATEVAEAISQWSEAEEAATNQPAVSVVVMASKNRLLVTGAQKQLLAVQGIARELDKPAAQVRVRMAIVELTLEEESPSNHESAAKISTQDLEQAITDLRKQGSLKMVARGELLATDSLPASVHLGRRVPRITGSAVSSRGQTNTVSIENVGTIFGVSARVVDDEVVTLELDVEHSHIGPQEEGTPIASSDNGVVIRTSQIPTLTLQTTTSVPTGKTVLLAGMVQKTEQLWRKTLVLLQAEIVR